jgi:hypothetical protein
MMMMMMMSHPHPPPPMRLARRRRGKLREEEEEEINQSLHFPALLASGLFAMKKTPPLASSQFR